VKIPKYMLAAVAALLALAPAAAAHVTLQPEEATAGDFTRLDVRVPNERDDASTTKVEVRFPPGFLFVSTEPVPGWNAEVTMRKLDKPVEQFGERITEEVDRVTFTPVGESTLGPGEFQDFGLSVGVPDKPGSTLRFPAVQTYSSGEVVRWIGPPDAEEPAPQVELTAAAAEGGASGQQAAQQQAPAESDDDDSSNTLSIIALIVGIAGLAAGLGALLMARRRTRVGAA
jgi:uncharacterized protein YcnI